MTTYNSIIKKRNAVNNNWDVILPITTADNVIIDSENSLSSKLKKLGGVSSYMTFASSTTPSELDIAFGKNNDVNVGNMGFQLAMYGWFKELSATTYPFTAMIEEDTFTGVIANPYSLAEIISSNGHIQNLIQLSPYAKAIYEGQDIGKALVILYGGNPDNFNNAASVAASSSAVTAIINSPAALKALTESDSAMSVFMSSTTARTLMLSSTTAMSQIIKTIPGLKSLAASDAAKTNLSNNITFFNSFAAEMKNTLDNGPSEKVTATSAVKPRGVYGTPTSWVWVTRTSDGYSSPTIHHLKHEHDGTEMVHAPFPAPGATGDNVIELFAIGGVFFEAHQNDWVTVTYTVYTFA